MKINAEWLRKQRACAGGRAEFRKKYGKSRVPPRQVIMDLCAERKDDGWPLWIANHALSAHELDRRLMPILLRTAPRTPFNMRELLKRTRMMLSWGSRTAKWRIRRLEELRAMYGQLSDCAVKQSVRRWAYAAKQMVRVLQGEAVDACYICQIIWGKKWGAAYLGGLHSFGSPERRKARRQAYRQLASLVKDADEP